MTKLQGKIRNDYWIWKSEKGKNTCEKCKSLDGKIFYFEDEIPEKPHPNCKCEVVKVSSQTKFEPCSCIYELNQLSKNVQEIIANSKPFLENIYEINTNLEINEEKTEELLKLAYLNKSNFEDEIHKHAKNCPNSVDNIYKEIVNKIIDYEKLKKENNKQAENLYQLKKNIENFDKETKNILIDVEQLKEFSNEEEHSKEECTILNDVEKLKNQYAQIKNEFENYKKQIESLTTKTINIQKAVNSGKEYLDIIDNRKKNICKCSSMLFLHEKTKELQKLPEKSEKLTKQILQKSAEELIGNNYNKIVHNTTKLLFGKDTAGMLDISHGTDMNDTSYLRDAIYLKNKNSPHIESSRKYLTKKLSSQFADYGFNINAIPGYFFKSNSEPVQRIINSSDFQKILKNNRSNILRNKNFSGQFANNGYNYKSNLHNAFGKVDFRNPYFDKEGNLHIKMYDTYDFNKTEKSILVKAGANQMEKGNLKPFFTIHDIIIKKEVWGNILLP